MIKRATKPIPSPAMALAAPSITHKIFPQKPSLQMAIAPNTSTIIQTALPKPPSIPKGFKQSKNMIPAGVSKRFKLRIKTSFSTESLSMILEEIAPTQLSMSMTTQRPHKPSRMNGSMGPSTGSKS